MKKYVLTMLMLFISNGSAVADITPDGVPLHTTEHGTINGGIYIGGGHGKEYTTNYTQNFTVPCGTVQWARLYVSAKDTTWINVSLNGHILGNYTDIINNSNVYTNYKTEQGMYWAYYDNAVKWIVNGTNTATAHLGTRVGFNTKSWGMALIVVYEGGFSPEPVEYWINEGNPLLHGDHPPFSAYHNTTNTSIGPINTTGVTGAQLKIVYVWGSEESKEQIHDTLWFNSELIAQDASDGAGIDDQGISWRGGCFDLEEWDVGQNLTQYNVVSFDRGMDSILCPVVTVLVLTHGIETATPVTQATPVTLDTPGFKAISTIILLMILTFLISIKSVFLSRRR